MSNAELRQDRIRAAVSSAGVDAMLVSSEPNVTYLTSFTGSSSYLIVGKDRTVLVSDGRYAEQIAEECSGLETYIRATTGEKMAKAVAYVCGAMGVRRLAFESHILTVSTLAELQSEQSIEWIAWSGEVEKLRAIKDSGEIETIRYAIAVAERAFGSVRGGLKEGTTERAVAIDLEYQLRLAGADRESFDTIVAVGPHAAQGHARPGALKFTVGEPIVVDWGASSRFYNSDLTRVLAIRTIPAKLEAVYEVVLKAQERAIEKIRPGMVAKDVDAEARAMIEESGFGQFFSHGTGHGIGLEVHEAPSLRPNSDTRLEPGMVVTVEPGIYIPGWGGVRIEDDVLVTRDGHEILSSLPKTLDSILIH